MSENIKVSPTPLQRNAQDVAVELLNCHIKLYNIDNTKEGELARLYSMYYATAKTLEKTQHSNLSDFLPEEVKEKF